MDNDVLFKNVDKLDEKIMRKLLVSINNLERDNLNTKSLGFKKMSEKIVRMIKDNVKVVNEASDVD